MLQVRVNVRSRLFVRAWEAIGRLLASGVLADGRLEIGREDARNGIRPITVRRQKPIHRTLSGKPVLHLDATLRPELARTILPDLEVTEIAAETPHMRLRLITGPFGKGSLCDGPHADPAELQRRSNRRAECVDYVRWHARRFKRTLVIAYKDIEADFAGIPGVEAAHFNAIAGLDGYRDVGLLIVVGRPLPGTDDLGRLCAALFGHLLQGGYHKPLTGISMRAGPVRGVRATTHEDARAEVLRAAVCGDELIQAIGRGRGVNRTADNPLEVHVLADVALPLVHDRLSDRDLEAPDVLQRMLLAGLAEDSPEHAARLHPELFVSVEAAKKAFQRGGTQGHSPISDIYREMSLSSAASPRRRWPAVAARLLDRRRRRRRQGGPGARHRPAGRMAARVKPLRP